MHYYSTNRAFWVIWFIWLNAEMANVSALCVSFMRTMFTWCLVNLICDLDYFWEQRLLDLTLHGSKLSSLFQIDDLCWLKCSGRLWCIQHLFGSIGLLVIDYNLQSFFLRNLLQPHTSGHTYTFDLGMTLHINT